MRKLTMTLCAAVLLASPAAATENRDAKLFKLPQRLGALKRLAAEAKALGGKPTAAPAAVTGAAVEKRTVYRIMSRGDIEIRADWDDCVRGWISMDVRVEVAGEGFDFDPNCGFSFDEEFATKSGRKCEVRAGMCTTWDPERRFEVACDDGLEAGFDVACPGDFTGDIGIEPEWNDCAEGWMSMDVRVRVGGERFSFRPNCSFPFSEDFASARGGRCRVEGTMCSGHFPERRFSVTCDQGQRGEVFIPCERGD